MYDKAYRAFDAANYTEALKQLDAIDARKPDLAASQNLRGVVYMRQGLYDKAEAALSEARGLDPKFWNARFNLAEIPFLKKDWAEARKRFQELLTSNAAELQGEATQLIQYKILLTYLLEGNDTMVDSILAKFELSPDTPAVHYANAAISLQGQNIPDAKNWMSGAEKNFSPQLNKLFAESLYEIGWLKKQAAAELFFPSKPIRQKAIPCAKYLNRLKMKLFTGWDSIRVGCSTIVVRPLNSGRTTPMSRFLCCCRRRAMRCCGTLLRSPTSIIAFRSN